MEPYMEEMTLQRRYQQRRNRLPRCLCCGEAVTEGVNLKDFGINGYGCSRCVAANRVY